MKISQDDRNWFALILQLFRLESSQSKPLSPMEKAIGFDIFLKINTAFVLFLILPVLIETFFKILEPQVEIYLRTVRKLEVLFLLLFQFIFVKLNLVYALFYQFFSLSNFFNRILKGFDKNFTQQWKSLFDEGDALFISLFVDRAKQEIFLLYFLPKIFSKLLIDFLQEHNIEVPLFQEQFACSFYLLFLVDFMEVSAHKFAVHIHQLFSTFWITFIIDSSHYGREFQQVFASILINFIIINSLIISQDFWKFDGNIDFILSLRKIVDVFHQSSVAIKIKLLQKQQSLLCWLKIFILGLIVFLLNIFLHLFPPFLPLVMKKGSVHQFVLIIDPRIVYISLMIGPCIGVFLLILLLPSVVEWRQSSILELFLQLIHFPIEFFPNIIIIRKLLFPIILSRNAFFGFKLLILKPFLLRLSHVLKIVLFEVFLKDDAYLLQLLPVVHGIELKRRQVNAGVVQRNHPRALLLPHIYLNLFYISKQGSSNKYEEYDKIRPRSSSKLDTGPILSPLFGNN